MRSVPLVAVVLTLACSSGGSGNPDGGAGGSGGGGGGGAPSGTCQAIRLCALDCSDEACVTTCANRGTSAAQAAFQALYDCTKAALPTGGGCATPSDVDCLCMAQCIQDPPCFDQTIECTANMTDTICDDLCH
jgi:hypothetical protein